MKCPKCSGETPAGKFCRSCGSPLPASEVSPGTVTCPSCGASVRAGAKFCAKCAAPLVAVEKRQCSTCGAEIKPGARFCAGCGRAVEAGAASGVSAPATRPAVSMTQPAAAVSAAVAPEMSAPPPSPVVPTSPPILEPRASSAPAPAVPAQVVHPEEGAPVSVQRSRLLPIAAIVVVVLIAGAVVWYYLGVKLTVTVTPADSAVFLDDKQLAPQSPGQFVVDGLSRGRHLLKVRRQGYGDIWQNLDPSITDRTE